MRRIRPAGRRSKLAEAYHLTELIRIHKENRISREEYRTYRDVFLGRKSGATNDPVQAGELGPNGFPVGYNEVGDKVEFIREDGEVWPLLCAVAIRPSSPLLGSFGKKCGGTAT